MFKELIAYYLQYFQEHGEPALATICNCDVPTKILLSAYQKLEPIESRPENEKRETWEYIKSIFPDHPKEEQIKFTKVIYTIGNLL